MLSGREERHASVTLAISRCAKVGTGRPLFNDLAEQCRQLGGLAKLAVG